MKIKVAVLDSDQIYLDRFVSAFSAKFADKVELYSFTNQQIAVESLANNRIDVFLASENFDIDVSKIPAKCVFAYFVDNTGIDSYNNQSAICKFQKADLIYKQFLSLYSEKAGGISSLKLDDDSTKVIIFSSPCGGVGTSTVAAACAKHFSDNGSNVLYLNLETFGSSDLFFSGEGQFDMSEVIYALKSKKTNLSMKLESCVRKDVSGVSFYTPSAVSLNMMELTNDDIIRLIEELKLTGSYNYIIVDVDFGLDKNHQKIYKLAHSVVWVSDGEEIANTKVIR
ncbi:MAG: chromosome partitioning protein ParA, partial [Eubacterium sp.]|nr:chromosome partitioning protein ParA [Eubacterium sp.]